MIFTYLLALLPLVNTSSSFQIQSDSNSISPQKKVNVKLGVMSRCPDATFTESLFDQIIDVEPVIDLITLELIYIGTINNDGTIESKHGEGEAQTDIKQLCAGKHWQNPSIRAPWLDTWNVSLISISISLFLLIMSDFCNQY